MGVISRHVKISKPPGDLGPHRIRPEIIPRGQRGLEKL